MKLAVCLGHSRAGDGGAVSLGSISEYQYHLHLVLPHLEDIFAQQSTHTLLPVSHYQGTTYGSAMRYVAGHLRQQRAHAAIELHFNAAGGDARGFEHLHWHTSTAGQRLALTLNTAMENDWGDSTTNRGLKPRTAGDRGSQFLRRTHCPAVIVESFFGDNPHDWDLFRSRGSQLAATIARGLLTYANQTS